MDQEPRIVWTGSNAEEIGAFQEETGADWAYCVGGWRGSRESWPALWRAALWVCQHLPRRFGSLSWDPPEDPTALVISWFEPVEPPEFPEPLVGKLLLALQATARGRLITRDDVVASLEHARPELMEWRLRAGCSYWRHARLLPGDAVTTRGEVIRGAGFES